MQFRRCSGGPVLATAGTFGVHNVRNRGDSTADRHAGGVTFARGTRGRFESDRASGTSSPRSSQAHGGAGWVSSPQQRRWPDCCTSVQQQPVTSIVSKRCQPPGNTAESSARRARAAMRLERRIRVPDLNTSEDRGHPRKSNSEKFLLPLVNCAGGAEPRGW